MEIEPRSRHLFMKYALPCAGTLVRRGKVEQEFIDTLKEIVRSGCDIPRDAEKIFAVAFTACSIIAKDSGKDAIDSDVIRQYFLLGHDDVIDQRHEEMKDFDPDGCRVRIGTVKSVSGDSAVISSPKGEQELSTIFIPGLIEGDVVSVHWDHAIERIDASMLGALGKGVKEAGDEQ